jgi:hypothetical protein
MFAQDRVFTISKMNYKTNEDVEIAKERVKAEIDKNKELSALQRSIAKKMAGSIVKRAYKQAEENRYGFGFPDGDFTQYAYWDIANNRSAILCPELGRITINDWKEGQSIVAFPKLKIAMVLKFKPELAIQQGQQDIKTMFQVKNIPDGVALTDVEGFPAIENLIFGEIEEGQTPERTIVIDGKTMEAIPIPGHLLAKNEKEYYFGIYVDGETNSPTYSMTALLQEFKECNIDEANFVLPEGYKIVKDVKALNKAILKANKGEGLAIPAPDKMPEVIWQ